MPITWSKQGGHHRTSKLFSVSLDGIKKPVSDLAYAGFVGFHHMYTLGKQGLLVQVRSTQQVHKQGILTPPKI